MEYITKHRGYNIYLNENNMYIIENNKREYKTLGGARQGVYHLVNDVNTNEYILYEDYAEIVITSDKFGIMKTQIDLEDIEKCKEIVWNVNKCYHHKEDEFYVGTSNRDADLLHRYLKGSPKDMNVDHVDGNTFNNRKKNLRVCTPMGNGKNRKINRNNTSGYKGVTWDKTNNKWLVHMCVNYKKTTYGYFDNLEDAVNRRLEVEQEHYKDFSRGICRKNVKHESDRKCTDEIAIIAVKKEIGWILVNSETNEQLVNKVWSSPKFAYRDCKTLFPKGVKANVGYLISKRLLEKKAV